jgi:peptidoglycan/xylan/chitin deacetylase (PgdA/CDA1 family)
MKKILVLSFDDGTIYDKQVIQILNKYHLRGTFNLNSGLQDYVWYLNDFPIKRLDLTKNVLLYQNHEVCSHSLTHPYLDQLSKEELIHQINDDILNLERIFQRKVTSFAIPFAQYQEAQLEIIKNETHAKLVRVSSLREDFALPQDPYHIGINGWILEANIYQKIDEFKNNQLDKSLFVLFAHSYEFELEDKGWEKLDKLMGYLASCKEIEVLTFQEAMVQLF